MEELNLDGFVSGEKIKSWADLCEAEDNELEMKKGMEPKKEGKKEQKEEEKEEKENTEELFKNTAFQGAVKIFVGQLPKVWFCKQL